MNQELDNYLDSLQKTDYGVYVMVNNSFITVENYKKLK